MKKMTSYIFVGILVCIVIYAAIWGPSALSGIRDSEILNNIELEAKDTYIEGYRYILSMDQKLYILSNALNNRILPQSDYFASVKPKENLANVKTQSYAFLSNYRDEENNTGSKEKALETLENELDTLFENGIIPYFNLQPNPQDYEIGLYTAIDVLEPQKSVSVWQIDLNSNTQISSLGSGLMSCYLDSETGKIYSLAIRTDKGWNDYKPDEIVKSWSEYLGSSSPSAYLSDNILLENTPYYKKYYIEGIEDEKTIVTIGFFEGINEFFIKISK